ncbi:hypothetical protein HYPSUDRAFT_90946, partial [Hypholoma sublateritium FD-334 SS-4]
MSLRSVCAFPPVHAARRLRRPSSSVEPVSPSVRQSMEGSSPHTLTTRGAWTSMGTLCFPEMPRASRCARCAPSHLLSLRGSASCATFSQPDIFRFDVICAWARCWTSWMHDRDSLRPRITLICAARRLRSPSRSFRTASSSARHPIVDVS